MSDRIEIKAGETGVVRVFDVDLDVEEAKAFNRRNGSWPLQEALGAEVLDPNHVDLFQVKDLEGYGMVGYLEQGLGVSSHEIEDNHVRLEALTGTVLVVGSRAFGGQAQVLDVRAPLHLVAVLNEDRPPVSFERLPDASATGSVAPAKAPPSDAAMSGRVAMIALLVIFALTAVVIWVAAS